VISLNDIVVSTSVRVGGNRFDEAIAAYIKRKYNMLIGERTAESVKIEIGSALPLARPLTMQVRGRDQVAGLPRTIEINSNEITEAIQEPLEAVVNATRMVLSETPPELSSDIIDKGMIMTGGGSMLRYFIKKASSPFSMSKPEVMICIPAGVTTVEMRAVKEAAISAGARYAYLIREPLAAAIGANIPVAQPSGNLIIDIGGGTTEVAVISLNDIVVSTSVRVGGNRFDEAIAAYIKRKYNMLIGERTAESVKIEIGSALPLARPLTMQVRGRDQVAGLPRTIEINSNEITEAIQEPLEAVVNATRMVLSETPPELSSDIIDKGMIMTGGGSMLRRINELLTEVTSVPCYVADQPANCVAIGTGLALEHIDILRDSLSGDELN
jgi:rod shape-determining protein MreB